MLNQARKYRFILADVVPPTTIKADAEKNLDELISLVNTFGGATIVRVIQRRASPDPSTYVGKGKAEELTGIVKEERINVVVLNDIVKPTQLFNLKKMFWTVNPNIEVWDRVDLILHIFAKHAHSAEAKLQIEMASTRHMGPSIFGMGGAELSRQGGGIGSRGAGETNTEQMKRHWRDALRTLQQKIDKYAGDRERQLQRRKDMGFKTISIVGYTNAGKSTLFSKLTKKQVKAKDELFATLDSTVGNLYLPFEKKGLLVSDTIGFIQNLPTALIEAFKSTLMESVHTDLLLHVIDVADPELHEKILVVENVLHDLGIQNKAKIYVFNKIDKLDDINKYQLTQRYADYNPLFISAQTGEGLPLLVDAIKHFFTKE